MERLVLSAAILFGASLAALVGCSGSSVFVCQESDDCKGEGNGVCQSNGFCAFPDLMCQSGLRYGSAAGGGFANTCVIEETEATGNAMSDSTTAGSSGSTASTTGSGTTAPTTSTATTTPVSATEPEEPGPTTGTTGGSSSTGPESSSSSSTTGPILCPTFFDDFDDTIHPFWNVRTAGGELGSSGGRASFRITADETDPRVALTSGVQFPESSVSVLVEVPAQPGPEALTQFVVSLETDSVRYRLVLQTSELLARVSDDEAFTDLASQPYDPATVRWFRVRLEGGDVWYEYSTNGSRFDVLAITELVPDDGDIVVLLSYDNFERLEDAAVYDVERVELCVRDR